MKITFGSQRDGTKTINYKDRFGKKQQDYVMFFDQRVRNPSTGYKITPYSATWKREVRKNYKDYEVNLFGEFIPRTFASSSNIEEYTPTTLGQSRSRNPFVEKVLNFRLTNWDEYLLTPDNVSSIHKDMKEWYKLEEEKFGQKNQKQYWGNVSLFVRDPESGHTWSIRYSTKMSDQEIRDILKTESLKLQGSSYNGYITAIRLELFPQSAGGCGTLKRGETFRLTPFTMNNKHKVFLYDYPVTGNNCFFHAILKPNKVSLNTLRPYQIRKELGLERGTYITTDQAKRIAKHISENCGVQINYRLWDENYKLLDFYTCGEGGKMLDILLTRDHYCYFERLDKQWHKYHFEYSKMMNAEKQRDFVFIQPDLRTVASKALQPNDVVFCDTEQELYNADKAKFIVATKNVEKIDFTYFKNEYPKVKCLSLAYFNVEKQDFFAVDQIIIKMTGKNITQFIGVPQVSYFSWCSSISTTVPIHTNKKELDVIRDATFFANKGQPEGIPKEHIGKIHHLDVDSLYPASTLQLMPVGYSRWTNEPEKAYDEGLLGFYKVDFRAPDTLKVPLIDELREGCQYFTNVDIETMFNLEYDISFENEPALVFDKTRRNLFSAFVESWHKIKNQKETRGFAKGVLNSLYGMLLKNSETLLIEVKDSQHMETLYTKYKQNIQVKEVDGKVCAVVKARLKKPNKPLYLGAFILAYSRKIMAKYKYRFGIEVVPFHYTHTDSLWMYDEYYQQIKDEIPNKGEGKIGDMCLEFSCDKMIVNELNSYVYKIDGTIKGTKKGMAWYKKSKN